MDKETIQQIATEVVAQLPFGARYSVVYGVVTVLIAGLSIWFGSFLKTKGQNFATKQDFNELQKQLKANTELVEKIKAEVGQKDWAQREWTSLRRTKLEALLAAMHDCEAYLERYRLRAMKEELQEERDPVREFSTLAAHFPELRTQATDFSIAYREECVAASNLSLELATTRQLDRQQQLDARQRIYDQYRADMLPRCQRMLDAARKLQDAASKLLVDIMSVEEGRRHHRSEAPTETH
jgi:hypothetical protein